MRKVTILAYVVLLLLLVAVATNSKSEPRYIVHANGNGWSTDVSFVYEGETGPTYAFEINEDFGGPGNVVSIKPRTATNIVNFGASQSAPFGVREFDHEFELEVESKLTFDHWAFIPSYIVVPSLRLNLAKQGDAVGVAGITNDGVTHTNLAFFNLETYEALVTVEVLDKNFKKFASEIYYIPPGLSFFMLQTKVDFGSLVIHDGLLGGLTYGSRIVGFAAVGKTGTPKVIPF
jgi:hypothetical protein